MNSVVLVKMLLLVRITLATLCTSPLFAAHALAFTLCVGLGITSGSGGALAEASNQALDLAIHSSALQPMLTSWPDMQFLRTLWRTAMRDFRC